MLELSAVEARRLALAAQGFAEPRGPFSGERALALAERLGGFQIDSVNVVVRAHYVPAYARLGAYPMRELDRLAYETRDLYEYWGHAASLLPISMYPLLRYRMHSAEALEHMRTERGAYSAAVYAEVAERGPLTASELSDPGRGTGKWWGWGKGKAALEHLFDAGLVAIADRRGFERVYDLSERVIPKSALDADPPPREEAMKRLICMAARASGVAAREDLLAYFKTDWWVDRLPAVPSWEQAAGELRRTPPIAGRLIAELLEEGRLLPARVEGWTQGAFVVPEAEPAPPVDARALVTPFDSLVWGRRRVIRLFGMVYNLELYVPAHRRVHGYYVLPFLFGDRLAARCDLKADRASRALLVRAAYAEPGESRPAVAAELAAEIRLMAGWLDLDSVEVADRGDLAPVLRRALAASRA